MPVGLLSVPWLFESKGEPMNCRTLSNDAKRFRCVSTFLQSPEDKTRLCKVSTGSAETGLRSN